MVAQIVAALIVGFMPKVGPILAAAASEHRALLLQLIRYGFAGLTITLGLAASYLALAELAGIDANLSLAIAFVIFSVISYLTHGSYSFRGHGRRDKHHIRLSRFVVVTLIGFAINQFFVWFLVKELDGPTWWPTVPIILVTPLITFSMLRRFVYA